MKTTDIRRYAKLMQELGLTGLEVTEDGRTVRLERTAAAAPTAHTVTAPVHAAAPAPASTAAPSPTPSDICSVRSPMVGVFYAAPAENAEPYVSIGDRVEKGATLCIVEAMKLMNEIAAEESGEVVEICVTNGQVVEYGTELFRIRRQA